MHTTGIDGDIHSDDELWDEMDGQEEVECASLSERLRLAIGDRKVPEVAEALSVAPSTLRSYLTGVEPKLQIAASLAQELGVSLTWLATGVGPMRQDDNKSIRIPYMSDHCFTAEQLLFHRPRARMLAERVVGQSWLRHFFGRQIDVTRLRWMFVYGDSMAPTLRNDNLAMVRILSDVDLPSEGIYVMRFSGAMVIRRVEITPEGKVMIRADNPSFSHYKIEAAELGYGEEPTEAPISIIGRVVYVEHKI